ncbi:MAG: hypothetical protein LBC20_05655 [Planctomycetaceae bacterium]|nr:hypothetical protein [Planctomycetaceae bacterium]
MSYMAVHHTSFNFPPNDFQDLVNMKYDFAAKFATAESPETRTKAAVKAKNDSRKVFEHTIKQKVKEFLTYNHLVTNEDRDNMGLPIHKTTRTPTPAAITFPDFDIDSRTIRRLTVHFYDQGRRNSKAKPDGQHGAEIRWAILETPPQKIEDMLNSSFSTRTPFTLEFDENKRGKIVYFCLCWENTRGEKGPWSEIISAIIP